MEYVVKTISDTMDIGVCEPFPIANFNWGGTYRPRSYGCMGNLINQGLYIKMVSEEPNPTHKYFHHNDPVYLDSALSVYLKFGNGDSYFRFEMNANGALSASYGSDMMDRELFSQLLLQRFHSSCGITEHYWYITLFLPYEVLSEIQDIPILTTGDTFTCNFYKQKASDPNRHYASWNPVKTAEPTFYAPDFFGKATII